MQNFLWQVYGVRTLNLASNIKALVLALDNTRFIPSLLVLDSFSSSSTL